MKLETEIPTCDNGGDYKAMVEAAVGQMASEHIMSITTRCGMCGYDLIVSRPFGGTGISVRIDE